MNFFKTHLKDGDPAIYGLIKKELARQQQGLEMIPSENNVSYEVLQAMGSILTNKYSEGYPKKRYYGGNEFVDEIEQLAIDRAKQAFKVAHANVQPYSGSPANLAVYHAVCKPGDVIMGHNLPDGGHLTHGWKASATGQWFKSIPYHVTPDGEIDITEVAQLAKEHKPKLIWVGASAYVKQIDFAAFGKIADDVGAYLAADIAHISGLVITGTHPSPAPHAHIITTTTHKTLRGPRGGLIMVTDKGLAKDPNLAKKIDKAIFPGLQGGPHDHTTAAIAVALHEALQPEFKTYCKQIIKNSKALAASLHDNGINVVGKGSENHTVMIDLTSFGKGKGMFVQEALDLANITTNKNTIPADPSSPFYPSGVRLGTPSLTTRGMKEAEMQQIGKWIADITKSVATHNLSDDKEERKALIKQFRSEVTNNTTVQNIKKEVISLCAKFPLYPDLDILS